MMLTYRGIILPNPPPRTGRDKSSFHVSCKLLKQNLCFLCVADKIIDNSRYEVLKFNVKIDSVLHGFTGYFDTILYKDIRLSIEPFSHSKGMVSWFPIFFPIRVSTIYTFFLEIKHGDYQISL